MRKILLSESEPFRALQFHRICYQEHDTLLFEYVWRVFGVLYRYVLYYIGTYCITFIRVPVIPVSVLLSGKTSILCS